MLRTSLLRSALKEWSRSNATLLLVMLQEITQSGKSEKHGASNPLKTFTYSSNTIHSLLQPRNSKAYAVMRTNSGPQIYAWTTAAVSVSPKKGNYPLET